MTIRHLLKYGQWTICRSPQVGEIRSLPAIYTYNFRVKRHQRDTRDGREKAETRENENHNEKYRINISSHQRTVVVLHLQAPSQPKRPVQTWVYMNDVGEESAQTSEGAWLGHRRSGSTVGRRARGRPTRRHRDLSCSSVERCCPAAFILIYIYKPGIIFDLFSTKGYFWIQHGIGCF